MPNAGAIKEDECRQCLFHISDIKYFYTNTDFKILFEKKSIWNTTCILSYNNINTQGHYAIINPFLFMTFSCVLICMNIDCRLLSSYFKRMTTKEYGLLWHFWKYTSYLLISYLLTVTKEGKTGNRGEKVWKHPSGISDYIVSMLSLSLLDRYESGINLFHLAFI